MTATIYQPARERDTLSFSLTRGAIYNVLANWRHKKWTLQGLGMLRCYLAEDKSLRLHVWSNKHKAPGASPIHTHPWDLNSLVIAGSITNTRYTASEENINPWRGDVYMEQRLLCGEGGGLKGEPSEVLLRAQAHEVYTAGGAYHQFAEEIHETAFVDGTVTVVKRKFRQDTEHASVFWKRGEKWGSAEPREASRDEVLEIIASAIKLLDNDGN